MKPHQDIVKIYILSKTNAPKVTTIAQSHTNPLILNVLKNAFLTQNAGFYENMTHKMHAETKPAKIQSPKLYER